MSAVKVKAARVQQSDGSSFFVRRRDDRYSLISRAVITAEDGDNCSPCKGSSRRELHEKSQRFNHTSLKSAPGRTNPTGLNIIRLPRRNATRTRLCLPCSRIPLNARKWLKHSLLLPTTIPTFFRNISWVRHACLVGVRIAFVALRRLVLHLQPSAGCHHLPTRLPCEDETDFTSHDPSAL